MKVNLIVYNDSEGKRDKTVFISFGALCNHTVHVWERGKNYKFSYRRLRLHKNKKGAADSLDWLT